MARLFNKSVLEKLKNSEQSVENEKEKNNLINKE